MLVFLSVRFEPASYREEALPRAAQAVGWVLVALCLLPIPAYALYACVITPGSPKKVRALKQSAKKDKIQSVVCYFAISNPVSAAAAALTKGPPGWALHSPLLSCGFHVAHVERLGLDNACSQYQASQPD